MLKAFPDKKFLLYGEGDLNSKALQDYDFIIFPSFAVDQIPSGSVDLFMNKNSLGEMNRPTAHKFLSEIERTANYFWHMNHEFIRNEYSDGSSSLVNSEYNISRDKFQRLFRYIDSGHAIYEGGFNINSDIYCYLYKRRS